jgi:hypothetical protein
MTKFKDEAQFVAAVSLVLYTITAGVALFFYRRLRVEADGQVRASSQSELSAAELQTTRTKRVVKRKKTFFIILFVSAALNIPFFTGCLAKVSVESMIMDSFCKL